jgi:quercetin dioxygenase-like cupin family protein
MGFIDSNDLPMMEPRPGFHGRFFHSEHMTFSYYEIAPGSRLHLHHHPEEEVWHIVDGELEMVLGDVTRVVRAGQAVVVPPNVEHAATASRACRAIVVDHPCRTHVGSVEI